MIPRPLPARWMNLLAVNDDLPAALVALARQCPVEPESRPGEDHPVLTPEIAQRLARFASLTQTFRTWWPGDQTLARDNPPPAPAGATPPLAVLEFALQSLEAWRNDAQPLIDRHLALRALEADRLVLADLAQALGKGHPDPARIPADHQHALALTGRVFVLPLEAPSPRLGSDLLAREATGTKNRFLLVVAPSAAMAAVQDAVTAVNGRALAVPEEWTGCGNAFLPLLRQQLHAGRDEILHIEQELARLGQHHKVTWHLREVARIQWFFGAIRTVATGEAFSHLGGWVGADVEAGALNRMLERSGVRALATVSADAPSPPPMLLVNPWWAKPFELFPTLLGTPGANEVDPSRLLAFVAPLLFGFMFGDLGQGLVIAAAGYALRRKLAASWLLMTGGISAACFGLLFGSFFCSEAILPALWLHPTSHPLTVLGIPLILGVLLVLTGMGFRAQGAFWNREGHHWLRHEGGVPILYLGLLLAFFSPAGWYLAAIGLAWFAVGNGLEAPLSLPARLAHLLETLMQLGVNTLSFARVGAFALAHAGLSQAVITLADLTGGGLAGTIILVAGNLLILSLEGLVVSVQTTRLILFEFFVRFLRGEGRPFRPLPPPPE
ncbi:MAG: hypothetical protein HQL96_05405 [Magnetococcales bacterium]|nr:hypothetical protein [Magnetococcales bacterium]